MTRYRVIPSIEQLRQRPAVKELEQEFGRGAIVDALREAASRLRAALASDDAEGLGEALPDTPEAAAVVVEGAVVRILREQGRASLVSVINATGVILHTNLGRAPLADAAIDRLRLIAPDYSNLEFDLESGMRGHRDVHAEALLCALTGAEAAVVVNNNAAALLLMLAALAAGRDVVVSRGELVEIGGGFRVPDVMSQSGARLREVGTTNRTRISDYASAIGPDTSLLLRVHRSNFRIEGFTERPSLAELTALGRERDIAVAEDLGSGLLGLWGEKDDASLSARLGGEPCVQESVRASVDLVCFSGDKLLGGPQAGIIVGRKDLVARIRRHPLMRAVRVDKLIYAALEGTLAEYAAGRASRTVPTLRMVLDMAKGVEQRAEAVIQAVGAGFLEFEIVDGASTVGGGTTPGLSLPTRLLAVRHAAHPAEWLDARLRHASPPVVGRIVDDRLVLDLRTVRPEMDATLAAVLRRCAVEQA